MNETYQERIDGMARDLENESFAFDASMMSNAEGIEPIDAEDYAVRQCPSNLHRFA